MDFIHLLLLPRDDPVSREREMDGNRKYSKDIIRLFWTCRFPIVRSDGCDII